MYSKLFQPHSISGRLSAFCLGLNFFTIGNYEDFLKSKLKSHVFSGFDIEESELNKSMFDFQKFIVKRALKAGKYAIFADCGLGKTLMQLDTIERLILLYSNKGDTVFTPFMGIGSEVYQAVRMGRKGIGFELKESYYDLAKKNLLSAVVEKNQLTLI